jgi:hypothetical protein
MQDTLPDDIKVSFEFDQSPYVTRAVEGVVTEGLLGAVLVGFLVLLFLGDWRAALVVVLNIPLSLMAAVVALWITGYTINVMTLGGMALAIGILVDEAAVAVENMHTQMRHTASVARAVFQGNVATAIPRLLAMLCILAVFVPALFMEGAAQALFAPLALAVGFAMIASYLLSSTFVSVASVWLLKHAHGDQATGQPTLFDRFRARYERIVGRFLECSLGDDSRLSGGLPLGDRGARLASRPRDLSRGRCGTIPPAPAGSRRHAHRQERGDGQAGLGADCPGGRAAERRAVSWLRRHDPLELPDQRRLSVVARPGRSDFVCRS